MLQAAVAAGQSGPVITLTGEVDLVSVAELSALTSGQTAGGTRELTIDASGLRFADTTSTRALMLAARTLLGADQMLWSAQQHQHRSHAQQPQNIAAVCHPPVRR